MGGFITTRSSDRESRADAALMSSAWLLPARQHQFGQAEPRMIEQKFRLVVGRLPI
jgi:hypothetical protein